MESAAADPQSKASARQVGLLPSAKSPKPSAEEKARSFDPILANPSGKAGFQKGKSTLAERSEFQNTYTNPDGTKIAEMSNLPLNVQGVDGEWRTIDKKVVKDGDGFRTGPHPVSPRFAERADDAQLVQASTKAGSVSLSLEGAADVAGVPSGEALVYGDVLDGVDLRYDVRQAQIEETLILTERSEPGEASWRFHLEGHSTPFIPTLDINTIEVPRCRSR